MKKEVWYMTDLCVVTQKVAFGEPVTLEEAVEMWMNGEYEAILDIDVESIEEFQEAK